MGWICSLKSTGASGHPKLHCPAVEGEGIWGGQKGLYYKAVGGEGHMVEKIRMVSRKKLNLNWNTQGFFEMLRFDLVLTDEEFDREQWRESMNRSAETGSLRESVQCCMRSDGTGSISGMRAWSQITEGSETRVRS